MQLVEFAGAFLAAGAVGFRYAVVRGRLGAGDIASSGDRAVYAAAARRAAALGLLGAVIGAVYLAMGVNGAAARAEVGVAELVARGGPLALRVVLAPIAIIGFALAAAGRKVGWPLAGVGVVAGALAGAFFGQWTRLVNPIHMLAGGLWIGTLFVLLSCGLSVAMRGDGGRQRRGVVVAEMVRAFSPFAMLMGAVLVTFGGITAWRHLKYVAALWTTPYGWTFMAKLCAVAVVFALGAWNWRRGSALGSDDAAVAVRRSARAEVMAAAVVLLITSVLVSLPSPRLPGPAPAAPAAAPGTAVVPAAVRPATPGAP